MTRYLVMVASEPRLWTDADDAARQVLVDAHRAFESFVDEQGRRISSAPLADADTATTVRRVGGEPLVTDGPFVDSVEMIGGYYDLELPDLDTAIAAAKLLSASYTVEIRPVLGLSTPGGP